MLVRIAGGVCIFAASVWLGMTKSYALKKREQYLFDTKAFLNLLEVEIQFSASRIKHTFSKLEKHVHLNGLLREAAEGLEEYGIRSAWENAVASRAVCLDEADRDILNMLGAELGMTDRQNQIKNIKHIEKLVEKQYESARKKREQLAKLYEGGGVLIGIFMIILLF